MTHCLQVYPEEAVGFFIGTDSFASRSKATRNVIPAALRRRSFWVSPFEHFLLEKECKARGEKLIACYHSHPDGTPSLSTLDVSGAVWMRMETVVFGVQRGASTMVVAKWFAMKNGAIFEREIVIDETA